MESPFRGNTHGGFSERPAERSDGNIGTAPQATPPRDLQTPSPKLARLPTHRATRVACPPAVSLPQNADRERHQYCSETDCGRPRYARGLCNNCYRKVQRRGGFDKHPRAKTAPAMRGLISTLRAKVRRRNRAPLTSSP